MDAETWGRSVFWARSDALNDAGVPDSSIAAYASLSWDELPMGLRAKLQRDEAEATARAAIAKARGRSA